MKTVTNDFKEQIKKLGREIDFKFFLHTNDKLITQDGKFIINHENQKLVVEQFDDIEVDETINAEDIYSVSIATRGKILSTLMKELDFEIAKDLRIGDVIDCEFGVKVGNNYEYVNYGNYMVYSKEFNEDTKTFNYVAYDRMLLTMQEASQTFLTSLENKTLAYCINTICNNVGLSFTATQEQLTKYPNLNKQINEGTFTDLQITYRDVLDMICQALGLSMIIEDKQLKLKDIPKNRENTITGNNSLYIEDAKQSNALAYTVDGATEQNNYSGKNLLAYPYKDTTKTNQGITFTDNGDGSLTIANTATGTAFFDFYQNASSLLVSNTTKQYTLSTYPTNNNIIFNYYERYNNTWNYKGAGSKLTFTPSSQAEGQIIRIVINNGVSVNGTYKFQLEESSTATSYEPYVGGTESPNPGYPQDVKTIPGIINLFNIDSVTTVTNGSLTNDIITTDTSGQTTFNINPQFSTKTFLAGKTYFISADIRIKSGVGTFGKINDNIADWTMVSSPTLSTDFQRYIYTKTFNSNTNYNKLLFQFRNVNSSVFEIKNIMIEESSIAHEYVPYGNYAKIKVTGKNLFNKNNFIESTLWQPQNRSTYSIATTMKSFIFNVSNYSQLTITKTSSQRFGISASVNYPASGVSATILQYAENTGTSKTINVTNYNYIVVTYYHTSDTLTEQEILNSIQIEQGSTATTYEVYKENDVLIDLAKENLFDGELELGGYEAGVKDNRTDRYRCKNKIKVQPNTTYTFSLNGKGQQYVYQQYGVNENYLNESDTRTGTFTTSSTCYYITFRCFISDYTSSYASLDVKLLEGTSPTPYYELCKIGDYKDILSINDSGQVVITKNIGKITLNGSETIYATTSTSNWYRYNISNIGAYKNSDSANKVMVKSNYFNGVPFDDRTTTNAIFNGANNTDAIYFNIDASNNITTVAQLKTWLSTHNTDVYYVLSTPQTITLSNTTLPLFEGINHITLVEDLETNTSLTYYLDDLAVDQIDETYLKDVNVSFGEKYGPVNSVVLSRSEDNDNIYRRDEESIAENGLCEFKIKDNLIMLYDDREDYIDEIFEQLNGLEYYINDFTSTGITYLDWLDFYNVEIGDKTYKCLMLNDEIKIEQGLEESVYTEMPEETVTDYKTSSKTDKEVSFIVDKQNGSIRAKVNKGEVINEINLDETGAEINASKISLAGKEIKLTSDDITISSTNFNVDSDGNMVCNNANVSGTITSSNAIITGGSINVKRSAGSGAPAFMEILDDNYNGNIETMVTSGIIELNNYSTDMGATIEPQVRLYSTVLGSTNLGAGGCYSPEFVPTSLEENKKNFELLDSGLRIIKNIDIYKYHLKGQSDEDKKHIGFVIGDNFKYCQEVTSNENNGADLYGFVSVCCKAIQEQQEQINSLKEEIKQLKESDK